MGVSVENIWTGISESATSVDVLIADVVGNSLLVAALVKDDNTKPLTFPDGWADEGGIEITANAYVNLYTKEEPRSNPLVETTHLFTGLGTVVSAVFKDDGMRVFVLGTDSDLGAYTLSSAWDLDSTITLHSGLLSYTAGAKALRVKPDGSKYFILSSGSNIRQFSLSASWDLDSTVTEGTPLSISGQTTTAVDIVFKPDGTKLFVMSATSIIYEYALSTAWDINSATYTGASPDLTSFTIVSFEFDADGLTVFYTSSTSNRMYSNTMTSAWDVVSSTFTGTGKSTLLDGAIKGLNYYPTADKLVLCKTSTEVYVFTKLGGLDFPSNVNTWTGDSEDYAVAMYELRGVDTAVPYAIGMKDNGKVATPGTDADATEVDFLLAGFGSDQYNPTVSLDAHLTQDRDLITGDCNLVIGRATHDPKASIPAMTHAMGSADECGGFYIGFVATTVSGAAVHLISPNSSLSATTYYPVDHLVTSAALVSPNSVLSANLDHFVVHWATAHLVSPNSYLKARRLATDVLFTALQLAYDVADLGIQKDFRHFRLTAHLSPDIEVPISRFTLRRIATGTTEGLNGAVTFEAYVPKGFDSILNQLTDENVTLYVESAYQGAELFAPMGSVVIRQVKYKTDKDTIYGDLDVTWPSRPDSIHAIANQEIIFTGPNQHRTIMRDDIYPGMFVNIRGVDLEVVQITMYAESDSGLTEILTR